MTHTQSFSRTYPLLRFKNTQHATQKHGKHMTYTSIDHELGLKPQPPVKQSVL